MSDENIQKYFCNKCKGERKHFVRAQHQITSSDRQNRMDLVEFYGVVECCGCENITLVKIKYVSGYVDEYSDLERDYGWPESWCEYELYPPPSYRAAPDWFEDLPDNLMREISAEIYKALQADSLYLATFGSRTLLDRLIVLTVGNKGNFPKGLKAMQEEGMLSQQERDILKPVIEAGHAAAHRGWAPDTKQIATILDTVEGLIHRLLVLPAQAESLKEAVPGWAGAKAAKMLPRQDPTIRERIEAAPKKVRQVYDALETALQALGSDVKISAQKHYMAFARQRNFASVQIFNQKGVVRAYLNIDPDDITLDETYMRDMRQIWHFGTGHLEVTLKTTEDVTKVEPLLRMSYEAS